MPQAKGMLVMNIRREFFAAILSIPRRKKIEYRDLSSYWLRRLENVGRAPFRLRLLNGMTPPVPAATIQVKRVVKNRGTQSLEFHLGRVLAVSHWDRRNEKPV